MSTHDAGSLPAGIIDFVEPARRPVRANRMVKEYADGQIALLEIEGGDVRQIGESVSIDEASDMADALVEYGGPAMPEALLKLALAVKVLLIDRSLSRSRAN